MVKKYVSYKELLSKERDLEYWHLLDKWTIRNGLKQAGKIGV